MNSTVRTLLFEPLVKGNLQAVVPDFTIETKEESISIPASLNAIRNGKFTFKLHFLTRNIPTPLKGQSRVVMGPDNMLKISGKVDGGIFFLAHVFPSGETAHSSRGTSTAIILADRLELNAEDFGLSPNSSPQNEANSAHEFSAHLIFHGPKLHLLNSGTNISHTNDFLGESSSSSFNTFCFSGEGWEAALIQNDEELHLHLRHQASSGVIIENPIDLVDRVANAVACTHGFQPWPIYREVRINQRVVERWLSTHLNLRQSWLAPVSARLAFSERRNGQEKLSTIISTISDGFGLIPKKNFDLIKQLLWNVFSTDLGNLPPATKLLIVCSALDGLMKVIGGDKKGTLKEWQSAAKETGLSWESWLSKIMDIRKKHRDNLSHGRLWIFEEISNETYFNDYPQLVCAFMIMVAAYCGYDGPIVSNPIGGKASIISKLKVKHNSHFNSD